MACNAWKIDEHGSRRTGGRRLKSGLDNQLSNGQIIGRRRSRIVRRAKSISMDPSTGGVSVWLWSRHLLFKVWTRPFESSCGAWPRWSLAINKLVNDKRCLNATTVAGFYDHFGRSQLMSQVLADRGLNDLKNKSVKNIEIHPECARCLREWAFEAALALRHAQELYAAK